MAVQTLPLPRFYEEGHAYLDPAHGHYHPEDITKLQGEAVVWRGKFKFKQSGADKSRVHLLIIDNQFDFDFPSGSLFVSGRSGQGAMDDQNRLAQWIYKYLHIISEITCTMDTHQLYQVFFPMAHLRPDGTHPDPFTVVTAEDYKKGVYTPNPAFASMIGTTPSWLQKQFTYYCEQVEKNGKYSLTLWPYHGLVGSHGHQLAGVIDEARLFHSVARGAANVPEIKGLANLTECYSIFQPEVMETWDGHPIPGAQVNTALLEKLIKSAMVVTTGQAASHCLTWSINDFLEKIWKIDPELAKKVYILKDCTSSVVVRDPSGKVLVDYTDEAQKAFDRFQNAGMNLVSTDEPIESWPGIAQQLFG